MEDSKQLKNNMLVELADQNKKLERIDQHMHKVGGLQEKLWGSFQLHGRSSLHHAGPGAWGDELSPCRLKCMGGVEQGSLVWDAYPAMGV